MLNFGFLFGGCMLVIVFDGNFVIILYDCKIE